MGRLRGVLLLLLLGSCGGDSSWLLEVRNEQRPWAIHASVVTEDGARKAWVVFHRGVIVSVDEDSASVPFNARRIEHPGYLYPGLIDAHNHAPWNVIPRWRSGRPYKNRYEWQADPDYLTKVNDVFYRQVREAKREDIALRYAEVRAVIGGTTLLQSTYRTPETRVLVRNLDTNCLADSRIPDIRKIPDDELKRFKSGLSDGSLRRVFFHIAEGQSSDANSAEEFAVLRDKGFVRPGVVIIHGVALKRAEFREMAASGMYFVWSPMSNEVLYGQTADVLAALDEGLTIALAPDWTISGSNHTLDELKVAWAYSKKHLQGRFTPAMLYRMVTSDAARVAGVDTFLGRIAPRYAADIFLSRKLDPDPFKSLLAAQPRDIDLVFVDGNPVYGALEEMRKWNHLNAIDELSVQGVAKGVMMLGDPFQTPGFDLRFPQIEASLKATLPKLAPLLEE